MNMSRKKERFVDADEMQEHLDFCRKYRGVIFGKPSFSTLGIKAYIEDSMTRLKITYKRKEACTYIFRKDLAEQTQAISGLVAYTELAKCYSRKMGTQIPKRHIEASARAILAFKDEYNKKRVTAWGYDQNSSYGWALLQPIPDCKEIVGKNRVVQDGEIGFAILPQYMPAGWINNENDCLRMIKPGRKAEIIFPEIESPFKRHVEIWYNRKVTAEDKAQKAKAKQMINFSVGYLQRTNPYIRAAVVEHANEYILSLLNEDSIYINTDAIVSLSERQDINCGQDVGQFKLEHCGKFAHDGFNYQWELDTPSYRHIPKTWFKKGFDILKDKIPTSGNFYELDCDTLTLYRVE